MLVLFISFFFQLLQPSTTDVLSDDAYRESESEYYFRGTDPNEKIEPVFEFSVRSSINPKNMHILSTINFSLPRVNLNYKRESDTFKSSFIYRIEVLDEDGKRIKEAFDKKELIYKQDEFYNKVLSNFLLRARYDLAAGSYKTKITVINITGNISYADSINFTVPKLDDKIWISDVAMYDLGLNETVASEKNLVYSRNDSLLFSFQVYKPNPEDKIQLSIKARKMKYLSETITQIVVEPFLDIYKLFEEAFTDIPADTVELDEDLFYENKYFTENANLKQFHIAIAKSAFSKVSQRMNAKELRRFRFEVTPFKQTFESIEDDEEFADPTLKSKTLTDSNFIDNLNKRIVSDNEVLTLHKQKKSISKTDFSFSWRFVPNRKEELAFMLQRMATVFEGIDIDSILNMPFNESLTTYKKLWRNNSESLSFNEGLYHSYIFKLKCDFGERNFFDFDIILQNGRIISISERTVLNNAWQREKMRNYLKYGLPDEISGLNYITRQGIYMRVIPKQIWSYKELSRDLYFYGNYLVYDM